MSTADACYTIIHQSDADEEIRPETLRQRIEKGSDEVKIETMRKIIFTMLNGDPLNSLLMPVIMNVMRSRNKQLKKLVHFYLEICPKTNPDGKLKQEMILEHRHSYVRKNAIFAIYTVYKHFDYLVPDAPELIHALLLQEADQGCKRNAFVMLCNSAPELAVEYLDSVINQVPNFDELLQMAVVDLIRKDCKNNAANKGKYIRCIFELLNAQSHSVKYEAATTLIALTSNPAAVKAAASCYIELIVKEADNNVKFIVLGRFQELREKHEKVLDDLVMEILRVLSSPDIAVRRKAIGIALDMVSSRNVDEVVGFLKKELSKTLDQDYDLNMEYRQLLIQSIHSCAIKFSEVAANVVHVLMEFLGDSNNPSAVDVIAFVREVVEKFPNLRSSILERLMETFPEMKAAKVFRGALWIVGEYCLEAQDIEEAWKHIRAGLGEIPILASEQRLLAEAQNEDNEEKVPETKSVAAPVKRVLADGTYATESAFASSVTAQSKLDAVKAAAKPQLRALLLGGDFYLGTALASTLTKLVLRFSDVSHDQRRLNSLRAEAMLIMTSIIRAGQSQFASSPIDEDSYDRIMSCLHVLEKFGEDPVMKQVFLQDTKAVFGKMVQAEEKRQAEKKAKDNKNTQVQADDLITFRQFSKAKHGDEKDEYELDLTRATGAGDSKDDLMSKLSRVVQLTGFSDPVYAEAYVNVHQFDIMLDVLIVNQTADTLQNLAIEFATLGDLKLVERPGQHTIAPHSFHSIKANIKVSSTETGVIFGNIVYDGPTTGDSQCVVLNDIHIDIMDYINPAYCTETQFRSMWLEFEWENKVNVNTSITDLQEYLKHIMKSTNMSCLTPEAALSGECGFLSANMYARSVFGEDALANLSIERQGDGPITGHVRIRSKTQGIALSLGDKITLAAQKVASAAA
ncbi:coatomer subunit beta [Podila epigama]|nr:coatomer subunit beta [Podila epigama]